MGICLCVSLSLSLQLLLSDLEQPSPFLTCSLSLRLLDHPYWHGFERKYANLSSDIMPLSESLQDTIDRTTPLWDTNIVTDLKAGKNVMIMAHRNSIKGILKLIDGISNEDLQQVRMMSVVFICVSLCETGTGTLKVVVLKLFSHWTPQLLYNNLSLPLTLLIIFFSLFFPFLYSLGGCAERHSFGVQV